MLHKGEEKMKYFMQDIEQLKKELWAMREQINGGSNGESIDEINLRITALQSQVAQVEDKIQENKTDISSLTLQINQLQSEIQTIKSQIIGLSAKDEEVEDSLAAVQADVEKTKTDISGINSTLNDAKGDITTLESKVDANQTGLATAQSDLLQLKNADKEIEEEISSLDSLASQLQTDLSSFTTSTNSQIGNLTTQISATQTSISNETSTRIAAIADLQKQIDSLEVGGGGSLSVAAESKSAGYCKFSNGLILQWGVVKLDSSSGSAKNVNFACAFTTTSYGIVCSHMNGSVSNDWLNSFKIIFRGKTYFSVTKYFSEGSEYGSWIAIGY